MDTILTIEDASELLGYSPTHLRRLAKAGEAAQIKQDGRAMMAWPEVKRLAACQHSLSPSFPLSALPADQPPPGLLIYTQPSPTLPISELENRVLLGNCLDWMRQFPSESVQVVVISPPYYGQRKYPGDIAVSWADGTCVGFGEETSPDAYIAHSVEILRHLKRILRPDGTIFWDVADTYQTRAYLRSSSSERLAAIEGRRKDTWREYPHKRCSSGHPYLKDKDLTLVPFLVAWDAQRIGLYVRSIIIWEKENVGLDGANDRPVVGHEYIFLFSKSRFYKFRADQETEESASGAVIDRRSQRLVNRRKLRTVWRFPTSSAHGGHTAAFPLELPLRCLRLAAEPDDLVFDSFAGSGTTLAAARLSRCRYMGCELVDQFVQDANRRLEAPERPLHKS